MVADLFSGGGDDQVEERDPLNLQVGDLVMYDMAEYFISARYVFNESGWEWYEYRLRKDGNVTYWLVAEDDDGVMDLSLFQPLPLGDLDDKGKQVQYDGKTYRMTERGEASVTIETENSDTRKANCRYRDFQADDGELLSIESWSGNKEASRGSTVKEREFEFYPGGQT